MKTRWLAVSLLLLTFFASACSSAQAASSETTLSDIYTAVAITVAAQANAASPTSTPVPTQTTAPTATPASTSTATTAAVVSSGSYFAVSACNSSAYVSDVTVDDGTEVAPGETFTKTWELSNNGTCDWSKHYSVVFVSGDDMDGEDTEIDQKVDTGESADVSVELTAPDEEGTYTGYWSLADASGDLFGQKVYVQIVVSDDVATSTPTASATPSQTPTATATQATSTATSTPIPATVTDVRTEMPSATATPTLEAAPTETPGR